VTNSGLFVNRSSKYFLTLRSSIKNKSSVDDILYEMNLEPSSRAPLLDLEPLANCGRSLFWPILGWIAYASSPKDLSFFELDHLLRFLQVHCISWSNSVDAFTLRCVFVLLPDGFELLFQLVIFPGEAVLGRKLRVARWSRIHLQNIVYKHKYE